MRPKRLRASSPTPVMGWLTALACLSVQSSCGVEKAPTPPNSSLTSPSTTNALDAKGGTTPTSGSKASPIPAQKTTPDGPLNSIEQLQRAIAESSKVAPTPTTTPAVSASPRTVSTFTPTTGSGFGGSGSSTTGGIGTGTPLNTTVNSGSTTLAATPSPPPTTPAPSRASFFIAEIPQSLQATCAIENSNAPRDGTAGPDILDGDSASERLRGLEGDDTIRGLAGDDFVNGNSGNDFVNGNEGNDRVHGGADNDMVFGGQGSDCVSGDLGDDRVIGGGGNDVVIGGDGNDILFPNPEEGGTCSDNSFQSCSQDWLIGGPGDDTFVVRPGDGRVVIMVDGQGTDVLRCESMFPKATLTNEGSNRYLQAGGVIIQIIGGNSSANPIRLEGCL